jgi:hypothetical protein
MLSGLCQKARRKNIDVGNLRHVGVFVFLQLDLQAPTIATGCCYRIYYGC